MELLLLPLVLILGLLGGILELMVKIRWTLVVVLLILVLARYLRVI